MKTILKHGDVQPDVFIHTCRVCGCEYTYEKNDTFWMEEGRNDGYRCCPCPQCRSKQEVSLSPYKQE